MKFQTLSTFCLATVAIAAPTTMAPRGGLTYDASNPPEIFTDASCKLTKSLTPGEPLSFNYPLASSLGSIVSPVLDAALGKQTVEDLDSVADQLCVNAQEKTDGGNGACQDALQAIDDFATAALPADQAKKYQCLLNLLCVAPAGKPYSSVCTYLLAGQDCIANRIIGVKDLECEGGS